MPLKIYMFVVMYWIAIDRYRNNKNIGFKKEVWIDQNKK